MEICESTFFIKSRTTETTINTDVPPIINEKPESPPEFPVRACAIDGEIAINPKNKINFRNFVFKRLVC